MLVCALAEWVTPDGVGDQPSEALEGGACNLQNCYGGWKGRPRLRYDIVSMIARMPSYSWGGSCVQDFNNLKLNRNARTKRNVPSLMGPSLDLYWGLLLNCSGCSQSPRQLAGELWQSYERWHHGKTFPRGNCSASRETPLGWAACPALHTAAWAEVRAREGSGIVEGH